MNISKKILNAINEGVLNALSFDDELPDALEVSMHRISNNANLEHINKLLEKLYYSLKLQEMLPDAMRVRDMDIYELYEFVYQAVKWYKEYGALYNPHLDGQYFSLFVNNCIESFTDNDERNLNWIDTSEVTNMSFIFAACNFNGDISEWDTSNVINMTNMFFKSVFNGNISKWDVSNVRDMSEMFCDAAFNNNISKWDVSNVKDMSGMFLNNSNFNLPLSKWDVSNVVNMKSMFNAASNFNLDISNWNVQSVRLSNMMFMDCPIKEEYKPKGV